MTRCHPKTGPFTSFDIRTKCGLFILFMAWTLMFTHPVCHAALSLVILAAGIRAGLTPGQMIGRVTPLTPLLIMIVVFTGFSTPSNMIHPENHAVLVSFTDNLAITRGGLLLGLSFILRLINMVTATLLLLSVTPLDELITLFTKLRLPRTLAFLITTAIRFVPELDKKRQRIITAQRARGIVSDKGGWLKKFRSQVAVMVPLIVNGILMAEQLTMALVNRGFGYRNQWTVTQDLKFKPADYFVMALTLAGFAAGCLIRFQTDWGRI